MNASKAQRIGLVGLLAVAAVAAGLWLALNQSITTTAPTNEAAHAEPHAPDLIDLAVVEEDPATGAVTVDVVISPQLDAAVEVEILSPAGLRFADAQPRRMLALRRGDAEKRERVRLSLPGRRTETLRVQLRVLDERGQPTMVITREKVFNPPVPNGPARVPVVHTLPDGSRIVEYVATNAPGARRP